MYTIRNAAPRGILRGIKDESGRPPVYEPEAIPTHLPHVYLFTERGPTLPQLVSGDTMMRLYGSKSFGLRSEYATHQTVLANTVNGEGNKMMVQRLVPNDARPPAAMRLSLDVMVDNIPQYERASDGTFVLDQQGNKIATGETLPGHVLRWVLGPVNEDFSEGSAEFTAGEEAARLTENDAERLTEGGLLRILESSVGDGSITVGGMVNTQGEQSALYPIMDFEVDTFGKYGNRMGIRLSAPTTQSSIALDDETALEQLAYLYRLQFVERPDENTTPKIIETLFGEQFVDFSFKEGVINEQTNSELYIDDAVIPSYHQESAAGMPELRPPFGRIHVYHTYLNEVLDMVHPVEANHGLVPEGEEAKHLTNILTGVNVNNVPYYTIRVRGPAENGVLLSEGVTHYAMGGADGTLGLENFDKLVRNELNNYGDLEADLLDTAMYPQSVIYDTGFTLETKKSFAVPMGRRKDMYVVVSTQDVLRPQNTPSEESSIAVALRAAMRMYPESEIYGTSTCRAMVLGHSGYLLNSEYKGLLPLTIEFAQKCANYMGAGTGIWNGGLGYDNPPNNHVTMFRGVNAPFKSANIRSRDWDTGLVWVQNYDRRSLFWPGVQTVYDDDSSVLNSAVNMMVAVELEKVADRTWRDLTGISYLTPGQFIERSNRLIEERTRARFDGRVIVVPETFYTSNDEQRGYSWSCNIHMYAPNMKTVGTFTIVARRIEDYEG